VLTSLPEIDRVRWLAYRNDAGEEIPAFALVRPTGADSDGTLVVGKPNSDGQLVYVNGPVPCPTSGYGLCTMDDPVFVLYDDGGTPAYGETWGAAASSWKLTEGKDGWRVLGGNDTTRTLALADRVRAGVAAGGAPVAGGANDVGSATIGTGEDITASGAVLTWGTVHNYDGTDFWDGVTAPTSGGSTTNRQVITFPAAGRYLVEAYLVWPANATGDRHVVLQWGTDLDDLVRAAVSQRACASGETRQGIVATGEVDADETMAVRVMQSSGGDLAAPGGILQVTFWPG